MRFKTLVLIPLIALLGGSAIHADATTLPKSQNQISANEAPQQKMSASKMVNVESYLVERSTTIDRASRSASRYPYASKAYNQQYAQVYMSDKYNWGSSQHKCLVTLWNRESGWNPHAHNRSSGAHGIPQSLPGKKMSSEGTDWKSNPRTQIRWGLKYIKGRYKTPCNALGHSNKHNWY